METRKQDKSNNVFLKLIKYGLVIYTAARSIDLVMGTMPPAIKMFALAVICGLDLALLAWDDYAAHKAKNAAQHTVGVVMIIVNLLGIGAALIADTATIMDPVGSRDLIVTVAMFGIPGLVLANIGALVAIDQMDPDRKLAEEQARHEREMALERARHDQAVAREAQNAQLELERLSHTQRVTGLRDHYMRSQAGAPIQTGATGQSGSSNGHTAGIGAPANGGQSDPKA